MNPRARLIAYPLVLAGVFLAGFLPQYLKSRRLDSEAQAIKQKLELAELRSSAGRMLLQVTQNNFGIASQEALQFFKEAFRIASETSDPGLKKTLEEISARRDAVTGGLAKADPAVRQQVQEVADIALNRKP